MDTVCFPGAGSFGSEFQALVAALKPAAWLVRYPGRYGRDFGVPAESFDAVARACVEQVVRRAATPPVLVGHSYGAYVAYATASRLRDAGTDVAALVLAGASAPARLDVSEQVTGTFSDAAAYLDRVDPGALADAPSDDWREVVVQTAVQDLRLLRQFDAALYPGIDCPVFVARGTADPLTTDATVDEWKHCTGGGFTRRTFPGGHSDFLRSPACTTWTREILSGL